jgi:hypothetical protein
MSNWADTPHVKSRFDTNYKELSSLARQAEEEDQQAGLASQAEEDKHKEENNATHCSPATPEKKSAQKNGTGDRQPTTFVSAEKGAFSPHSPEGFAALYEGAVRGPVRGAVTPAQDEPGPARPLNRRQATLAELEEHFCAETGLKPPLRETSQQRRAGATLWWNPLWEIYHVYAEDDPQRAKQLITLAVRRLRDRDLDVLTPGSIVKTANFVAANFAPLKQTVRTEDGGYQF